MDIDIDIDVTNLKHLEQKEIVSVYGEKNDAELIINTKCGLSFIFYHNQDCCEDVYLDDIEGDYNDLVGNIVLMAEIMNSDLAISKGSESFTWTFYRILTKKGMVVFKFYGESNGYYSESVSVKIKKIT